MELQISRTKKMQIVLRAVMADGWLLSEMKFLKSLRFFTSSESVFVFYSILSRFVSAVKEFRFKFAE